MTLLLSSLPPVFVCGAGAGGGAGSLAHHEASVDFLPDPALIQHRKLEK